MSASSIKRRIGRFHVVVVQWTSKKLGTIVMHVQTSCFAHKTNSLFYVVVVVVIVVA